MQRKRGHSWSSHRGAALGTALRAVPVYLLFLAGTLAAAERSLEIERFAAKLDVLPEGVVRVEERIEVDFRGSWNGIYREIPFGFTDRLGVRGKVVLEVQGIEDGEGGALRYEESRGAGRLRLKI